ncbi:hypothetical protein GCM10028791_28530 [Echinicola sediminis]
MKPFIPFVIGLIFFSCQEPTKEQSENNIDRQVQKIPLSGEIIDLTYAFSDETVYWVTSKEFELEEVAHGQTEKGYFYAANNFETSEHGGTHVDAPIHFAENGLSVDEIPWSN